MVNLSSVDLNRLLALHAVLEERSVSRAAARLHVTPPAVSNTLALLREQLGDPLVVRAGRGLVPTPLGEALAPRLAEVVAAVGRVLEPRSVDPRTTTRTFSLACSDAEQIVVAPRVAEAFARELPRARLRIVSVDALAASGGLAADVDAAIAPAVPPSPGHHALDLFDEEGVLVVRRDHPQVRGVVDRDLFNALRHVDILLSLGQGGIGHRVVEDFLASLGLRRDVAVTVPTFSAAAAIVARTDWIGGMPRRLADLFVRQLPLVVPTSPLPGLTFRMQLHWHERTHADPGGQLFRALVAAAATGP